MLLITVDLDGELFAKCPENGMGCHTQVFHTQREINHSYTSLLEPNPAGDVGCVEYQGCEQLY